MRLRQGKENSSCLGHIEGIERTAEGDLQPHRTPLRNARPQSLFLTAKNHNSGKPQPLKIGVLYGSSAELAGSVDGKSPFLGLIQGPGKVHGAGHGQATKSSSR